MYLTLCGIVSTFHTRFYRKNQSYRACSSKGRIVILGRIVSASGQIFRYDFRPQDEIFRPKMTIRPLDEQALTGFLAALGYTT